MTKKQNIDSKKLNQNKGDLLFNTVAKRLKIIRSELGISQAKITEELNLKLNSYIRLETGKGGSITTLLLVLDYYAKQGYNYKWILQLNNDEEFRKEDNMRFFTFPKEQIISKTKNIKENIIALEELLKDFDY